MPACISSRVLQYDEYIQEKNNYVDDLKIEIFENDFYRTMNNAGISDSYLLNGCLYINTDDISKHPTMKSVLAITNYKRKFNNKNANIPILIYKNSSKVVPLNN